MVNLLQFLVFFQYWKINIHPSAFLIITQIRKLALFEFIDTSSFTEWIKSDVFGMPLDDGSNNGLRDDFCDLENPEDDENCEDEEDDELFSLRRLLEQIV